MPDLRISRIYYFGVSLVLCVLFAWIPVTGNAQGTDGAVPLKAETSPPEINNQDLAAIQAGIKARIEPSGFESRILPMTAQDINGVLSIVPHASFIPDMPGKTSFQNVPNLHKQGDYRVPSGTKTLSLGVKGRAHWLVFSIRNDTGASDWVLDFGDISNGRTGLLKELFVYNLSSQDVITRILLPQAGEDYQKAAASMPIQLTPGSVNDILIFITPHAGMPVTITPRVMSAESWFVQGDRLPWLNIVFYGLTAAATILIILGYAGRKIVSRFFFMLYILCFMAAYGFLRQGFIRQPDYVAYVPGGLIFAGFTFATLAVWAQMHEDVFSGLRRLVIILGLAFGLGAGVFLAPISEDYISLGYYGPILIMLAGIFYMGLSPIYEHSAPPFSWLSWISATIGYAIGALMSAGWMETNFVTIFSFWAGFLLHLYFMCLHGDGGIDRERSARAAIHSGHDPLTEAKEQSDYQKLLKVMERERKTMHELRDREAERVEQMRQSKDAANEANRAKSAFLAMVSHEIRTPMTGIMGMVQLLKDTSPDDTQADYIDTIQESSESMLVLLNDILDFEKVETGKMQLEAIDFDLVRLADSVVSLMGGPATGRNNRVVANIGDNVPQYVRGDPKRLKQVLLNLVGNAIKFTDNGIITLSVQNLQDGGNENHSQSSGYENHYDVYFSVEDNGIGIPKAAQKNLFNPFSQAEKSTARKFGGTGLGLAISQRLIEAMGGFISVNSKEGEGSTFFFSIMLGIGDAKSAKATEAEDHAGESLPGYHEIKKQQQRRRQDHRPSAAEIQKSDMGILSGVDSSDLQEGGQAPVSVPNIPHNETDLVWHDGPQEKTKTILVVDDNAINRKVMTGLITRLNHNVKTVETAGQGIEAAHERVWDMIFMDIELPDMLGTEATKILLADPKDTVRQTPIIALTGNVRAEDIQEYKDIGMIGTISKPIKPEELQQIIDDLPKRSDLPGDEDLRDEDLRDEDSGHVDNDVSDIPNNPEENFEDNFYEDSPILNTGPADQSAGDSFPPFAAVEDDLEAAVERLEKQYEQKQRQGTVSEDHLTVKSDILPSSPEVQSDDFNAIPPFNEQVLGTLAQSLDQAGMEELIGDFWVKAEESIAQLQTPEIQKDAEQLRRAGHDLKGMAGNFGLMRLSQIAGMIEEYAKAENLGQAISYIDAFGPAYSVSQEVVQSWLKNVFDKDDEIS